MEKKASIIYVKNGIENEIILDKFDNLMLSSKLKDIFEIETIIHLTNDSVRSYKVKNDVEKVWIKNFKFTGPNRVNIKGCKNQNCIFILEDCIFKNDSLWFWNFGNLEVKVLNVKKLPKERNLSVQFWGINDASVILSDANSSDIDIVVNSVHKFNLESNNNLEELDLSYVDEISLKNFNSRIISSTFCLTKKVCATNCLIKNLNLHNIYSCNIEEVMLDNSFIRFEGDIDLRGLKQLNLINSGISSNGSIYMDNLEKLEVEDDKLDSFSYLEVGEDLFISGEKYNNTNLNEPLRIAASDLAKGLNNGIKLHKRCLSRDEKK